MKKCEECHIQVQGKREFCPLCGASLKSSSASFQLPTNEYPDLAGQQNKINFMLRLFLTITIVVCGVSILVNYLIMPHTWWSLLVLGGCIYSWAVIPPLTRKGVNYASQAVLMVILTALLVPVIDFFIGYTGWSVTYVIPSILIGGILTITLLSILNYTKWSQYVIYQVIVATFGFIPLLLYFLDISQNVIMVIVTAALGFASIVFTIIFGDRSVKNEFKRRFHV